MVAGLLVFWGVMGILLGIEGISEWELHRLTI